MTETFFSSMLKGNLTESQGYPYLIHMPLILQSVNHVNYVSSFLYNGVTSDSYKESGRLFFLMAS